jgi:hypothetical protein
MALRERGPSPVGGRVVEVVKGGAGPEYSARFRGFRMVPEKPSTSKRSTTSTKK